MKELVAVVGSFFLIVIGFWKYSRKKIEFKQKQAEQAKEDFENAKTNDSESDFLDSFNRV